MEIELDPEIIKTTQNSLGKYVKRPALSEKLLKKPPFRFLHDIVTSVLKSTGFFEGLFDEGELISENVKDRESKIAFLNKVVSVLSITTGKSLQVKPSKIVAGQEADKTNELLQCLAYALDKNMSSQNAVEKFKANSITNDKQEKQLTMETKSIRKVNDDKKLKSSSTTKLTLEKKDSNEKSTIKQEKRLNVSKTKNTISDKNETGKAKKELASKQTNKQSKSDIKIKANGKPAKEITPDSKSQSDLTEDSTHQTVKQTVEVVEQTNDKKEEQEDNRSDEIIVNDNKMVDNNLLNSSYILTTNNDLNSSLSSQDLMEPIERLEADDTKETSDGNPPESSVNSETVNKSEEVNITQNINQNVAGFTKLIKESENKSFDETQNQKNSALDRVQSAMRPSSSRPGAPRLRDKHDFQVVGNENVMVGKVKIIQENTSIEEEEDTSIIIVDPKFNETEDDSIQLSSNQHGHLVQQILDSTKVYSQNTGKTEIEWQFDALKVREASNQEIEQVRFNIQALSRVANPLGKLLDHIQEDVEVMRQELQQWTKTYEDASKELTKQKTANEESLLPLHIKIKQLNLDIDEKHDKINDLKITIHKNASRIDKLLASGHVQ